MRYLLFFGTFCPKECRKGGGVLTDEKWVLCPICKCKTRIKVRLDTILVNFPLFCPKCKQEILISVKELKISVIKEPDA